MPPLVAGAPVSFGVFELTRGCGGDITRLDGRRAAGDGLRGDRPGPVGYLGRGEELRGRLRTHGLALAGGWIDLPFSDDRAFEDSLGRLHDALDVMIDGSLPEAALAPRPTLADSGDERRRARPGGAPELRLSAARWDVLERNLARTVELVRGRGLEPTFHHHACTYVETPDEIDELLARTDIGLTFDTGHLLLGGGDPLEAWRRWAPRIDHLHLKDVRVERMHEIVATGGGMLEVWSGGVFVPLGQGDLEIPALMTAVAESGYSGWIVIEQDVMPGPDHGADQFTRDHAVNRDVLRTWF